MGACRTLRGRGLGPALSNFLWGDPWAPRTASGPQPGECYPDGLTRVSTGGSIWRMDTPAPALDAFARLRAICLALPEAVEKPFGGHTAPAFRVRDKMFASCMESIPAVTMKAPPGAQEILVGADPRIFFVPPYVGSKGWIGVRLDRPVDWGFLAGLIRDSYVMTAPKRLAKLLD